MIVTDKKKNSLFPVHDPLDVKLLTSPRLQFSHLNGHKFRHGFGDTVSYIYGCNAEIENTEHFLLRCCFYSTQRFELSNNKKVNLSFAELNARQYSIHKPFHSIHTFHYKN